MILFVCYYCMYPWCANEQCPDALAELAEGCTTLFIDINGNRELSALAKLLTFTLQTLRPRTVVVKSSKLYRSVHCNHWIFESIAKLV